jgi:uncharacterized membrane protein
MTTDRPRVAISPTHLLLALGITAYILIFTAAAFYKYDSYLMGFDLGVHEQVLWNTAHGRIAASSAFANTDSYFGIDIIPTELLLAPIYALFPSVYTMLFLKTLALALGAVPVYLLVRDRFQSLEIGDWRSGETQRDNLQSPISNFQLPELAGLVFAAAFLLYLPVQYMNLYEFQIRAFATTFLVWAFYGLERRRFGLFLTFALLALGCRSEVGLVLIGVGVYGVRDWRLEIRDWQRSNLQSPISNLQFIKFGVLPILFGLGWFILCLQVLIPMFRNGAPSLYLSVVYGTIGDQPWLGNTPGEIFRTLLTQPGFVLQEVFFGAEGRGAARVQYLIEMFLPFGFLLLLQPRMLLITLPIFGLNLLSNTPQLHAGASFHYQALIIPFMVIGSAYALEWLIWRPTADDRRRTTDDRRPTTDDRRPTTDEEGERGRGGEGKTRYTRRKTQDARRTTVIALIGMIVLAVACNLGFRNPFFKLIDDELEGNIDRERIAAIERVLAQVPPDAPLTTTSVIGPHASRRSGIFFFPGNVIYPQDHICKGQFLLIDSDEREVRAEGRRLLTELEARGEYVRIAEDRNVTLWERVEGQGGTRCRFDE